MRWAGLSAAVHHRRPLRSQPGRGVPGFAPGPTRLVIRADLYRAMIAALRRVAPWEGCGLIATSGPLARKLYPGTNTERSETRYNMDPAEVVEALREIRERGWRLGAIYHSHPRSRAAPSRTDLDLAYYPEALMVIVSLMSDPPVARAFRVDGRVRKAPIIMVGEGGDPR